LYGWPNASKDRIQNGWQRWNLQAGWFSSHADRMEMLLGSISGLVSDLPMPDVLALVLRRTAGQRLAGVLSGVLLKALL